MQFVDGRGQNKVALAKENLEKVRAWYEANEKSNYTEACKGTSLTYKTVPLHASV